MTREDVTAALFTLLSGATAWGTTGRRVIDWRGVSMQPAMFLRNNSEEHMPRPTGLRSKVVMHCEIWIYSKVGEDPAIDPASGLNDLLDAIDTAMAPPPRFTVQTLGGLVTHCWIEGEILMHPGDLGGQAIAIIPVKILVPTFGG